MINGILELLFSMSLFISGGHLIDVYRVSEVIGSVAATLTINAARAGLGFGSGLTS